MFNSIPKDYREPSLLSNRKRRMHDTCLKAGFSVPYKIGNLFASCLIRAE